MARGGNKPHIHHHSEALKAAVISAVEAGLGICEAAETYGVPQPTVSRWMLSDHVAIRPLVNANKKALDVKLEELAHKLLDAAPSKIEDAGLLPTMTSGAIAIDKMRLLREQSTSITDTITSPDERDRRLIALLDQIERNAIDADICLPP